ncbi:hypothetical protein [Nocardia altamirensis]|uniref:hypothetical protein n=1 Tax=Nocardia altamirensis TaxID=472158 RepID=UPI00114D2F5E|nr:hypothetical protein [Nocardia altamirensis]
MTKDRTPPAAGDDDRIWVLTAHLNSGGAERVLEIYPDKRTALADFLSRARKRHWYIKPWRNDGLIGEALTEDCWHSLCPTAPGSFPSDIDSDADPEELLRDYIAANPAPGWM